MPERIVVAANRLPFARDRGRWMRSPGGLVTALTPVLRARQGVWIGWSGSADTEYDDFEIDDIHNVHIALDQSEVEDYYLGFCNRTIWPLLHDAVRTPEYHREWWLAYQRVNQRFAEAILRCRQVSDLVWIHDYHLLLAPEIVRRQAAEAAIRIFLHIPFPPIELFARLPWRRQVLEGMLGADVIGVQTQRSAANFVAAASMFTEATRTGDGLEWHGRDVRLLTAPISVEVADFARIAAAPETVARVAALRHDLGDPEHIILGADRLDYTKGIDVRLRAFGELLAQQPALAETVKFVQIAVPSRETIGDYSEMRESIDQLAGRINSVHGHHMPVHYVYESLSREELVSYYRAADVMAVTPLADGMNLVAKEYVASRIDEDGVLVLSEFAGAAQELGDALLVNPYDIDSVAGTLARALTLEIDERKTRMRAMRSVVISNDLESWVRTVLADDPAAGLGPHPATGRRWRLPISVIRRRRLA